VSQNKSFLDGQTRSRRVIIQSRSAFLDSIIDSINDGVEEFLVRLEDINGEFTYIERVHSSTPSLMESVDRLVWGGYN